MWIIPSSIRLDFAAASECSKKPCDSDASISAGEPSLRPCVSGKPTLRPFSWNGWKARPWSRALFGAAICETSTGSRFADWWTSSVLACPASRTASPESRKATRTKGATTKKGTAQSRISSESWPSVAPPWSSAKTSLPGFQEDGFDLSEKNYQDWVTRSKARSLSLRNRLTRAIGGSESLSWPTIRAQEDSCSTEATDARMIRARKKYDAGEYGDNNGPPSMNSLNYAAGKWPTPDTGSTGSKDAENREGGASLGANVAMWPTPYGLADNSHGPDGNEFSTACRQWSTPQAHDQTGAASEESKARRLTAGSKPGCRDLTSDATIWATPAAHERANTPREVDHGIQLANQADSWATPANRDYRSPNATSFQERSDSTKGEQLVNQIEHHFLPPDQRQTGDKSRKCSTRRLNPAFVCWLMGWPWWWTRAEPINFAAAEMALWRRRQQLLLSNLCGGR